jgi:hypothetical protein
MKTTPEIKSIIESIISDNSGMLYTDAGGGSGGLGYADSETLREMLEAGDFDDAEQVELDHGLCLNTFFSAIGGQFDHGAAWVQIEFDRGENNYRVIGWIWEDVTATRPTSPMRLTGREAIAYAERYGLLLCKYNDPIKGPREDLTVEEANEIAIADDGLIYLNVDLKPTATKIYLSAYTGYRHNRYDGFNCSWGVLMALGASRTADAFADEDDYPDDAFQSAYDGEDETIGKGDNDEFRSDVLGNLNDDDINAVKDLEVGETAKFSQYWGQYEIAISVTRTSDNRLLCVFDGYGPFEVFV